MHYGDNNDFIRYEEEIYSFIQISKSFFHVYREHLECADAENQLLIFLFSAFGRIIVKDFDNLLDIDKIRLFQVIESMISSDDKFLSTITATGLLESIVINAENQDKSNKLFLKILKLCHKNTYLYIKEWSAIHDITINNPNDYQ